MSVWLYNFEFSRDLQQFGTAQVFEILAKSLRKVLVLKIFKKFLTSFSS